MSIKSKIQSLISAANTATGKSDTTLTGAVQTLVDGYGQGGGGVSNCQIIEFTLATHSSTNVTIGTLSDEAYSHIDDDNFSVAMLNTTPTDIAANNDYMAIASNNPGLPAAGNYVVYGDGLRKTSSSVVRQPIYYPPKDTTNATSLGGLGKFWHNGKTLYYKSASYYLGAGTYRVVITW